MHVVLSGISCMAGWGMHQSSGGHEPMKDQLAAMYVGGLADNTCTATGVKRKTENTQGQA